MHSIFQIMVDVHHTVKQAWQNDDLQEMNNLLTASPLGVSNSGLTVHFPVAGLNDSIWYENELALKLGSCMHAFMQSEILRANIEDTYTYQVCLL